MEDPDYEANVYVQRADAVRRKAQVDDVRYEVNLALPRGDWYGGQVTVTFVLTSKADDLWLDFRGAKVG